MKISSKRTLSRVLSFVMLVSAMCTNLIVANAGSGFNDADDVVSGSAADAVISGESINLASSGNGPISVWDFGGVEESDTSLYTNYISTEFLDGWTEVGDAASGNQGKFLKGGTFALDGGLTLTTNSNDRMFYLISADGTSSTGIRSYGANAKAITAYDDGYTANGMWYANGTGGDNRRLMQIDNVAAGSEIKVYTGCSNSSDAMVEFTYLGSDGTQNDEIVFEGGACNIAKFIAKYDGSYKVWFSAAGGKPIVNRIVKTPPVDVTVNVDVAGLNVDNYDVQFKNNTTEDTIDGTVSGTTVTAKLTPGYTYTAILKGAVGFGFTSDTKTIDVTVDDLKTGGKTATAVVEVKETYTAKGKLIGFDEKYDVSKLVLTFIPEEGSTAEKVVANVTADLTYSATLEPDVVYTAVLSGVNDYEVTANGTISGNGDITQDITVSMKATYTVTGKIVGGADVKSIAFVNVDDNYSYGGAVSGDSYTVILRDGSYEVQAMADGFKTSGHIVVNGKNVTKDILFVPVNPVPPTVDTSVRDIYVGCEGQVNNFETMGEALEAAKVMNPSSEAERVTIHIAPGTYREQISVTTPYLTFVSEGNGDVVLSWYYGIGYYYYSIDNTGYYNKENAFDKFERNTPNKWGVGTYVKKGADGFKAENIKFEASFNKYITDEEIADGVEETGALPARTYAVDVTSKAATERSTAICVEADNVEFKNCSFIGSQDTLYMGDNTHTYYKNCMIEGNTDDIFGSGNAVFDGCELRFCGYSDVAMGGYITAGRSNNAAGYMGYLFRACTITNKEGMEHTAGYFGRPWDANADITFLNTTLENSNAITAEGWTSMSGVAPEAAKFKEYGTMTAEGTPVDTSKRITGTVMNDTDAAAINAKAYFNGWIPTYYVEDSLPVEFVTAPYFSTDGDVLLPATGNTFTVKYSLGANDANDASKIVYSLVDGNGVETVVKSTTAAANNGIKLNNDMIGKFLKATVTPCTIMGNVGKAVSIITEKEITLGSGSIDTDRPSGKAVVFLAGDSTVKDYSAGAINNSGANRPEGSWGEYLGYFLNDNYEVMDYAQGGRSSRTFIDGTTSGNDKYLDKIKEQMVAGDYLFIQFGHNDSSASYADRYVPVGTPDANGVFPSTAPSTEGALDGTFKYYLQQYIDAAKAVGATPVMVTPVSRMYFNADGTIKSHHGDNDEYVIATKQIAEENNVECIDLYTWTKNMYENAYKVDGNNGSSDLAYRLFAAGEKTHHSKLGGFAIAADLAKMLQNSSLGLANAVVTPNSMYITDDKGNPEFIVNNSGVFTGYGRNSSNVFDANVPCAYWDEYINNVIKDINSTEITTETTTEATTETTTENVNKDGVIEITPDVVSKTDSQITVAYKIAKNTAGFNNYTMYLTFDSNVLRPVNAENGDIAIDSIDALGNSSKVYASNADNIVSQFTDVPAAGNTNFQGADGVKTQAELGKVKVSYCIFDKDFSSAGDGSLPKFTDEGTLFTVTYDIKGDVNGTALGVNVNVINAVSSDLNIASTPSSVISNTYTFEESSSSSTTEGTTSESTTEKTTEGTTSESTTEKVTEGTTSETTTEKTTEGTTSETTTEKVTEGTTSETTTEKVTEGTTSETTTEKATEATTAVVTEETTEVTTQKVNHYSGGAGASSVKVSNYTATTEAASEETTESENSEKTTIDELPSVEVVIGSKDIVVDGKTHTMDVAPYIQSSSNSTLVPLRFVAIAIAGGDVEKADTSDMVTWDAVNKQATIKKNDTTVVFTAGSNIVVINGVETSMKYGVVAEIEDSRMFVPFRTIGEVLGADVDWDADTKTAYYNR